MFDFRNYLRGILAQKFEKLFLCFISIDVQKYFAVRIFQNSCYFQGYSNFSVLAVRLVGAKYCDNKTMEFLLKFYWTEQSDFF